MRKDIKVGLYDITIPSYIKTNTIEYVFLKKNLSLIDRLLVGYKLKNEDIEKITNVYIDNIYFLSEKLDSEFLGKIVFYLELIVDNIIKELEADELYLECHNLFELKKRIV